MKRPSKEWLDAQCKSLIDSVPPPPELDDLTEKIANRFRDRSQSSMDLLEEQRRAAFEYGIMAQIEAERRARMWQKLVWPSVVFASVVFVGYITLIALGRTVPSQVTALVGLVTTGIALFLQLTRTPNPPQPPPS